MPPIPPPPSRPGSGRHHGGAKADASGSPARPVPSFQTGGTSSGGREAPASVIVLERSLGFGPCQQGREARDLDGPCKLSLERSVQGMDSLARSVRVEESGRLPLLDHHDRVIWCVVDGVEDAPGFVVHRRNGESEGVVDGGELAGRREEEGGNNYGFSHGDHR